MMVLFYPMLPDFRNKNFPDFDSLSFWQEQYFDEAGDI
jgi:hypothetical protein